MLTVNELASLFNYNEGIETFIPKENTLILIDGELIAFAEPSELGVIITLAKDLGEAVEYLNGTFLDISVYDKRDYIKS